MSREWTRTVPNSVVVPASLTDPATPRARPGPIGRYTRAGEIAKDLVDRALATLGLAAVTLPLILIAIAIRIDSPGPALFRQIRLGRRGRPFVFYKFRGMFHDARERFPDLYDYTYSADEVRNLRFHAGCDPRVTRIGQILRRTSLDELPNLINVVIGQMSLIGPRPEIPELIRYYGPAAGEILSVKPGIASLAKVVGRDNLTFSETLELDVEYVRNRSFLGDLRLMLAAVYLVVTGRSVGH